MGFAVDNCLLGSVQPLEEGTERLLKVIMHTDSGSAHLISAYALTLTSSDQLKDAFYEKVDSLLGKIPPSEQVLLLCDLNARVVDYEAWPDCLGKYGIGKISENWQRLF